MAAANLGSEGSAMATSGGDPQLLTDSDLEALAWQFLNSDYVGDAYAKRPLDQRLHNFLRRSGLIRVADNGDLYNIILDRVMSFISRRPGRANKSPAAGVHVGRSPVQRSDHTLPRDGWFRLNKGAP
jgi:hypothetical protein